MRGRCAECARRCAEGARKVHGRCNAYDLIGCGGDPQPMRFILGAQKVRRRCTEGAWKVHRRCTEGVQKVHGRSAEGAQKVHGRCNANDLIGCGGDP